MRAMQLSPQPDENVSDQFGGSRGTLVSAEQAGRTTFLTGLDPPYHDVSVARWEQFKTTPPNEAFPHNCWDAAFRDYHVAEWLVGQRRHTTPTAERSLAAANRTAKLVVGYSPESVAGRPLWWWYTLAGLVGMVVVRTRIRGRKSQPCPIVTAS